MNLHNVVKLLEANRPSLESFGTEGDKVWLDEAPDARLTEIERKRKQAVLECGRLPEELETKQGYSFQRERPILDEWAKLSKLPKTLISSLRELCYILGFVIIPLEYLNPESLKKAAYYWEDREKIRRRVYRFSRLGSGALQTYVLCPAQHYSLDIHVRSQEPDLQIYGGRHAAAFMSVQITLPLLRELFEAINSTNKRVDRLDSRMTSMDRSMASMNNALNGLKSQLDLHDEYIFAEADKHARQSRLPDEYTPWGRNFGAPPIAGRSYPCSKDPMMFSVAKGTDINTGEGLAFIGPCWGPDLDETALIALGLEIKKGEDRRIKEILRNIV